jgi:MYXO-CTERM domain-containing protein
MKKLVLGLGLFALCLPVTASAHFNLVAPPPTSTGVDGGKGAPPCGDNPSPGTATPAQGGHTISIMIDETVQHDGFYRFALAINALSEIPVDNVVKDASGNILPPNGMPMGTSATAAFEAPAVFPVLADDMFVHKAVPGGGTISWKTDLMLPNVNCASCTLQVIEFMANHPFNTGGGYFYHHCANLKITADPSLPLFDPTAGGASAGGASSAGGSAGAPSPAGGVGGVVAAGGGQTSTAGASTGSSGASSGGASSGSSGAAPTGASSGGASSGGASAGGASSGGASSTGTSSGSGGAADNNGCSCALGKGTNLSRPLVSLLLVLLIVARRRRRRVSEPSAA